MSIKTGTMELNHLYVRYVVKVFSKNDSYFELDSAFDCLYVLCYLYSIL